jgi:hypothetical protein
MTSDVQTLRHIAAHLAQTDKSQFHVFRPFGEITPLRE